ncbi:MAG: zinc ribbon domain-containing protein [Acidobacteria bacterium]|nr:zinc ribbon domain-containing protein [Acidobacteriota bacterium]
MFCSRCGASLADGSQFCVECGHTVEEFFPRSPAPSNDPICPTCGNSIFPGARFCSGCGSAPPPPPAVAAHNTESSAIPAHAPAPTQGGRVWPHRVLIALVLITISGAVGWVAFTKNAVAPQIKAYLTTSHVEMITDGSIALKPHGFASYRVIVPKGALDVAITGEFNASGRTEGDIQVYLLNDTGFVLWQSGYATSSFYESGKISQAKLDAPLPPQPGTYYLVFSNKLSRMGKTVRIMAGLRYDTWFPDSLVSLKEKISGWFE